VAVNGIYASIIPSYKYNLVLKSFSYGTQVMGHPVQGVVWCQREKIFVVIYSEERYCQLNSGSNLLAR
jgi:hypothetical protein